MAGGFAGGDIERALDSVGVPSYVLDTTGSSGGSIRRLSDSLVMFAVASSLRSLRRRTTSALASSSRGRFSAPPRRRTPPVS